MDDEFSYRMEVFRDAVKAREDNAILLKEYKERILYLEDRLRGLDALDDTRSRLTPKP